MNDIEKIESNGVWFELDVYDNEEGWEYEDTFPTLIEASEAMESCEENDIKCRVKRVEVMYE